MTQDPRTPGPAPVAPQGAPAPVPNAPVADAAEKRTSKHAIPIFALLGIWIVGGLITWSLAGTWGWTQKTSYPLRTGTMQVTECHANAGSLFVAKRCTGTVTFAPESTWSGTAQRYLKDRRNIALVTREGKANQTVEFTCYDTKSQKTKPDWKRSDAPIEECRPNGEVTKGMPKGPALWIPLLSGLLTLLGGIGVCALLLRLLVKPDLDRAQAAAGTRV